MTFRRNATTQEKQLQKRKHAIDFNLPIERTRHPHELISIAKDIAFNRLWQDYIVPALLIPHKGINVTELSNEIQRSELDKLWEERHMLMEPLWCIIDFSDKNLLDTEETPLIYDKETQTRKPLVLNAKTIMGTEEFTQFVNEGHPHAFQLVPYNCIYVAHEIKGSVPKDYKGEVKRRFKITLKLKK